MIPLQYKKSLEEIRKSFKPDLKMRNYLSSLFKQRRISRNLVSSLLLKVNKQLWEMKRMKWKKNKDGNLTHGIYTISKLTPLPFEKKKEVKYWLGKTPLGWNQSVAIGIFPDLETAKYVAYLITKK